MIVRVGGARREKCYRLGFASGVSVCKSTSLSQFKGGLCQGSSDRGYSFPHRGPPPRYRCCTGSPSPFRQLTSPTLRALRT